MTPFARAVIAMNREEQSGKQYSVTVLLWIASGVALATTGILPLNINCQLSIVNYQLFFPVS
jgi:hypothetical protein